MNDPSFLGLVQNIALLLALVLFFDIILVDDYIHVFPFRQVSTGFLIGAIGVVVMLTPWVLVPGAIFDTRSVLLSMSGLFFGAIPTLVAMAITAAFRIYQGGSGALTGVLVILATGSIGIIWRQLRKQPLEKITWKELYLFGVFTHLVMLALMLTFPWDIAQRVLANISLPVMIIYPLGTVLLGILMTNRQRCQKHREVLLQTTARLNATQQLTKMGGWEWDIGMQSMFWTEELYRIHGFSPEEIPPGSTEHIDKSILCYEPDDRPIVLASFQNCIEKGLPYNLEVPFTNLQGERIWVRTQAEAVREKDKIVRVVGTVMDISERKQAEQAISESEKKYRHLVENANDIVYSLALDGVFTYVSPSWTRILGHAISEVENHSFQIFVHPDDLPLCLEFLEKTITTGEKQAGVEYRVRHKDGTWHWHTTNSSPVHDANGKVVSFLGIARDITNHKNISEEQAYLSRLVDSSPASITIHDKNGKFLYANDRTFKLHGYSRDEFMKINVHQLDVPESEVLLDSRIRQVMENGEVSFEVSHFRKDGSRLPLHISARITELGGEQVIESIAIDLTDRKQADEQIRTSRTELQRLLAETEHSRQALLSVVEDQKEAEEQVRQLNTELEQRVKERTAQLEIVNNELEAFSYSVSHDLRAPLRALDGFSGALISDYQAKLDDQGILYLNRIQEASRRMGQLIEDLLNLSRISRREVNLSRVDLSLLARQIADELKAQSPAQSVDFKITPGLIVQADPGLMKIALENLLHNALKYSSKKEMSRIQVGVLEQPGAAESVFFVRDNGAGFDMDYADKLFTPFQRLHGTREFSGTGIGLTIVQRIITRHGGRIWPEAVVNQGATFYFTLGGE